VAIDETVFRALWPGGPARYAEQESFWNRRADEFGRLIEDPERKRRVEDLLAWLNAEGVPRPPARVLDIGCGPGTYAIFLAQEGYDVTGVDIAERMVERARAYAERYGVAERTHFVRAVWEELDLDAVGWRGAFDFVFASNTPAIRNADAFLKMVEASRNAGFLSSFVWRRDSLREELEAALGFQSPEDVFREAFDEPRVYAVLNLLWLRGFHPSVTYRRGGWTQRLTVEDAVDRYLRRFVREAKDEEALRREIRAFLERRADAEGTVTTHVRTKMVWIFWRKEDDK